MTEHAVVIAGGGPTGLMFAGELAFGGVDVAIVERRPSQDLPGSHRRRRISAPRSGTSS
jgi:3-(3-hydroxy-phenyl)propionate hydroxylase